LVTMGSKPNSGQLAERRILNWGGLFAFIYVYRCLSSVFAEYVIMRVTFIGDTWSYQRGLFPHGYKTMTWSADVFFDVNSSLLPTVMTAWLGGTMNSLFGGSPVLINIGFQTICFVGIVYLLNSVEGISRKWLAILVMLPSFSIWTSIASKEAIVAGALAVVCGYLLRIYFDKPRFPLLPVIAAIIVYIYKPHYLVALSFGFIGSWLCSHVKQKAFLALTGGFMSLSGLYILRDEIDRISFGVQRLFLITTQGGSSQSEPFFIDKYDVFLKAPLGMFKAFMGPGLADLSGSVLNIITFAESVALLTFLVLLVVSRLKIMPAYNFIIGSFVIFWILFPNYPFGIMNVGSAVRYRSGWIILVFTAIVGLMSRQAYFSWSRRGKNKKGRLTPIQPLD
jgi:hypothetical protein